MKRASIIGAISKIFSEMYYINLKDNTIEKIASDDLMQQEQKEDKDARTVLRELADTQVVGAFRPMYVILWTLTHWICDLGIRALFHRNM